MTRNPLLILMLTACAPISGDDSGPTEPWKGTTGASELPDTVTSTSSATTGADGSESESHGSTTGAGSSTGGAGGCIDPLDVGQGGIQEVDGTWYSGCYDAPFSCETCAEFCDWTRLGRCLHVEVFDGLCDPPGATAVEEDWCENPAFELAGPFQSIRCVCGR